MRFSTARLLRGAILLTRNRPKLKWSDGRAVETSRRRALPFTALQQRLGRKKVSQKLIQEVPVAYVIFDVLYANGELLIDHPLRERAKILDRLLAERTPVHHRGTETQRKRFETDFQRALDFASPNSQELTAERGMRTTNDRRPTTFATDEREPMTSVIRAPVFQASTPEELNKLFDAAQARGNEGLMIKDPESPYTPGRRGKSWLKLKRELATLDVVVTAVEWGHGKRIGVLSDYTFAVRDGDATAECRESIFRADRCRNRRDDEVVSRSHNRRPRFPPDG